MAKLNISQAAKLYGKDRSSIQRKIKKGEVSYEVNENGHKQIDLTELIRVYGEPPKTNTGATLLQSDSLQRQYTPSATPFLEDKIITLEQQVKALQQDKENIRNDLTEERESRKQLEKQLVKIIDQQHQLMLEDKREKEGQTESTPLNGIKRWLRIGMISFNTLLILITLAMFIRLLELWYGVELVGRFF